MADFRTKPELKVLLRICKEIYAFPNFKTFEISIDMLSNIAKQNEGWLQQF